MLKRDAQAEGYKYMTLDKLIDATRPILTKHGLVLTQWPSMVERGDSFVPALVTVLSHAGSDDSMDFTCPLYVADKTMQGLGAAATTCKTTSYRSARTVTTG